MSAGKLSQQTADEIRARVVKVGETANGKGRYADRATGQRVKQRELAAEYGVSQELVSQILTGLAYTGEPRRVPVFPLRCCDECGAEYRPRWSTSRFHSRTCFWKHYRRQRRRISVDGRRVFERSGPRGGKAGVAA